jgi:hypothetical protein
LLKTIGKIGDARLQGICRVLGKLRTFEKEVMIQRESWGFPILFGPSRRIRRCREEERAAFVKDEYQSCTGSWLGVAQRPVVGLKKIPQGR